MTLRALFDITPFSVELPLLNSAIGAHDQMSVPAHVSFPNGIRR